MSNRNVDRYDNGVKRESRVAPSDGYRISSLFETTVVLNAYGEDFAYRSSRRDSKPSEGGRWVNVPQLYNRLVSTRSEVSVYDDATNMQCVIESDFGVSKHRAACLKVRK